MSFRGPGTPNGGRSHAVFVPFAVAMPRRDEDEQKLDRLAWVWIAVVIGFFSIPLSKRSPYILPLAPAVAILVAGVFERLVLEVAQFRRRTAVLAPRPANVLSVSAS